MKKCLTDTGFGSIIELSKGKEITKMLLQFTLFCKTGQYKPMSTVIDVVSVEDYKNHKTEYQQRAVAKICSTRKMTTWSLKQNGYSIIKVRPYEKKEN